MPSPPPHGPAPARPRLLYGRDLVADIRAAAGLAALPGTAEEPGPRQPRRAGPDARTLRDLWLQVAAQADALLAAPLVPESEADGPDTQHGDYGRPSAQVADMGLVLGIAYHVTGDTRYADRLRGALLHYGSYAKWYGRGLRRNDPPWQSELNTARFCFGFAAGYDALRGILPASDRAAMAAALVRLGILPTLEDWVLPEHRIHALDSMGHNWWSVCISQAGLAALALLGDDPRAEPWARAAGEALDLWFAYAGFPLQNKTRNFDPGGAFYESVGYADYGLAEFLLFRLAFGRSLGDPPSPAVLSRAGGFFLHTCYPAAGGLLTVNFGDSSLRGDAGRTAALLAANGFGTPELAWYLARARPVAPALALVTLAARPGGSGIPPEAAAGPSAPIAPRRPDGLGLSALYPEAGWAVLRSSWDDDATLLAVKCGFTWNHAHADAGSFILFHGGRPLVCDSGTCSYARPEYQAYYCQSRAHNVVLCDGEAQPAEDIHRGVPRPGRLGPLLDGPAFRYLCADATGPTARRFSRNFRHFLWIGSVLLVLDDVRVHEPGRLEWLLHHGDAAAEAAGGAVVLGDGPERLAVRPLHPAGLARSEADGLADHRPDVHVPCLSFALPEPAREAKFLTAFVPHGPGGPAATVEAAAGADWIGARVREGARSTDLYVNLRADGRRMHRNSNLVAEGWETDAYLFALAPAEGEGGTAAAGGDAAAPAGALPAACLMAGGSYLRRGGRVVFSSPAKLFAAFADGPGGLDVRLAGQPRMRALIGAERRPSQVAVAGGPAAWEYEAAAGWVRIAVDREDGAGGQ